MLILFFPLKFFRFAVFVICLLAFQITMRTQFLAFIFHQIYSKKQCHYDERLMVTIKIFLIGV